VSARAETELIVKGSFSVMRWVAAAFFFAVAGGTAYMAYGMFNSISPHSDTSADAWITLGSFYSALAVGAVIGGFWVLRRWPS
jgi:uncharacterized membrane protein YoaK (UPF0700 family)